MSARPAIVGLAGWSGSGKTALIEGLIPQLARHGFKVTTVKHAHHDFEIDVPGKDSWRHRAAGASEVVVSSARRWAVLHENRGTPEPALAEIVARLSPTDIVLVEGYKHNDHPKIEVHRPSTGASLLCHDDETIVAVASDAVLDGLPVPLLDLNDAARIADFIVAHCGLAARVAGAGTI